MTHTDDLKLNMLLKGELSPAESAQLMEHIAVCDECSERMAELTLSMATVSPPEGLSEDVLSAAAKEKTPEQKQRESFMLYCLRVTAGICAAIVLLFSGLFKKITEIDFSTSSLSKGRQTVSENIDNALSDFSYRLFNWEDNNNDQKK